MRFLPVSVFEQLDCAHFDADLRRVPRDRPVAMVWSNLPALLMSGVVEHKVTPTPWASWMQALDQASPGSFFAVDRSLTQEQERLAREP